MLEKISSKKINIIILLFLSSISFNSCVDSEISKTSNASGLNNGAGDSGQAVSRTFSGTAIDIFSNQPLTDTWLCLADGATCVQTDGDGKYTFQNITDGNHTITPHDGDGGSVLQHSDGTDYKGFSFTLSEDTPSTGFRISTGSSEMLSGSITITTSWKHVAGNADIDSHLIIPLGGDCNEPTSDDSDFVGSNPGSKPRYFKDDDNNAYTILDYLSKLKDSDYPFLYDSSPFATLDLDDRGRSQDLERQHPIPNAEKHMETMKIKIDSDGLPKCTGVYHFYLNNYNKIDSYKVLEVNVQVLKNGSLVREYNATDEVVDNKFWGVFDILADGSISDVLKEEETCTNIYPEVDSDDRCTEVNR